MHKHKYGWEESPRLIGEKQTKSTAEYKCKKCGKIKFKIKRIVYPLT